MDSESTEDLMAKWGGGVCQEGGVPRRRAMRALISEYLALLKDPAEGFTVTVEDPFNWEIGLYGPPDTPYWGGYFKVVVSFPVEYPFEPPKLVFKDRFWHPNVYLNGAVCMSILHEASDDTLSGLSVDEKWNPTLNVRTVILSLISLISSPNPDSPANVDATKMYRSWVDGDDDSFPKTIKELVEKSKKLALDEGVKIPSTLEEYCRSRKVDSSECLDIGSDSDLDSDSCPYPDDEPPTTTSNTDSRKRPKSPPSDTIDKKPKLD